MIQLRKSDLTELSNDLKLLSALCLNVENKLTAAIKQMQPQLQNDNFGTDGHIKHTGMRFIIDNLDSLDKLKGYTDGLIIGIEEVQRGVEK